MKIAISICATKNYTYAMRPQARRIQAACIDFPQGDIILVGDDSPELAGVAALYKELMPSWTIHLLAFPDIADNHKNYASQAQLLISQMRTQAACKARQLGVDYLWSLDSDVLPPANSLHCLLDTVRFDSGWYDVAMVTYPSQGMGGMLGGMGSPQRQILPNHYPDELDVPTEMAKEMEELHAFVDKPRERKDVTPELTAEMETKIKRLRELEKDAENCQPKGNIFELNAKRWRRRGWLDNAYPAIGLGSILPTDWTGFGCTLMSRKALSLVDWSGYGRENPGTEDLYINWWKWQPVGIRAAVITHCLCDHVCRDRNKAGKYVHVQAYHDTTPGSEYYGHIRIRYNPFYTSEMGEVFNPENDGVPTVEAKALEPKPAALPPS